MTQTMVLADHSADYQLKEGAIIVAALIWVLMLGSTVIAAWILCGWRGAKHVEFSWKLWQAKFYCR
ncbi:hypothetical protein HY380_01600 [Candidatus Saccharibacteria bacterium]|nr:hypothetical protein [Candidatus Saccharibacteria bacterium]